MQQTNPKLAKAVTRLDVDLLFRAAQYLSEKGFADEFARLTGIVPESDLAKAACPTCVVAALRAIMDDFGITSCYCSELAKGKCGFCLGKDALMKEGSWLESMVNASPCAGNATPKPEVSQEEAAEPRAERESGWYWVRPYGWDYFQPARYVSRSADWQCSLVMVALKESDLAEIGPRIPPPDDVCPVSPQRLREIHAKFYPADELLELAAWIERGRV